MCTNSKYTNIAFISYKREDEAWAKWLQKKLEYYKLPTEIRKKNPDLEFYECPRHIFKDTTDLSGGVLAKAIKAGLDSSKFLVVICSPRAAKSEWVCKEVQDFIDTGREEYIIPFIVEGEPYAKDIENECFPEALRSLAGERELLGININENGREAAAVKVISRMFELHYDTLWNRFKREELRKRRNIIMAFCFAIVVLLSIIAYGIWANKKISSANKQLRSANNEILKQKMNLQNANDSIIKQKATLQEAFNNLYRTEIALSKSNTSLRESNKQLKEERDNVIKANWKIMENQALAVSEWTEKEEDPVKQIAMLLKVLPSNYANPDRPYTTEVGTRLLEIFNTTRIEKVFNNDKVAKYAEIDKNGENILAVYKEDSATTVKIWNAHKGQAEQKVFTIPDEDGIANFSPNGEYVMLFPGLSFKNILTPCGKILIHNVKTWKKIFSPQEEFDFASFHPHKELILANSYKRGQVKVFDFKKKKELFSIENDGEVLFTKFSPNGNKFIIIPREGDVQIRNTVTGTVDCTLKRNGFISFYDCSFSSDGSKLVTASSDSTTRVWIANTGQQIASCKHKDAILQSKFNSDGTEVLAMSYKHVALWNVQDNSLQTNITCKYGFTSASYSYDCKRVLTSEDGGDVKIWDKRNGKELVCFKHRGVKRYYGYVSSAQYFNNDKNVLTASSDGSVRIWKTSSPNGIIDLVHNKTVDLASFSPDSKQVITTCMWEDTTRIWETNTGRLLKKYPTTKNKAYPSNCIYRNSGRLNLPTNTPAIPWIWNLLNQETPQANMQRLLEKYNSYCAFNKMLLAVNRDELSLINPLLQTNIYEYKSENALIDFVVFDPRNYNIAVALGDSSSVILNGKLQTIRKFKHKGRLKYCALSPDGKLYSTSSRMDSCTITYNLKTGKERYRVNHSDEVMNIQYSPSGNKIGVILSNTVQLIDSSNGNIIGELSHDERINSLQFCSDGSYIATSSHDNSIKIWDSITCQCVYVITHNQNDANYVSFSPDSKYIVTASYDKTAKLYRFWPVQALIEKCKGIINNYELPDENKHNYYLQ